MKLCRHCNRKITYSQKQFAKSIASSLDKLLSLPVKTKDRPERRAIHKVPRWTSDDDTIGEDESGCHLAPELTEQGEYRIGVGRGA